MSSRYVEPMTLTTANTKSHADVRQVSNCLIKPSLPLGLSVRFSESGGNSVRFREGPLDLRQAFVSGSFTVVA